VTRTVPAPLPSMAPPSRTTSRPRRRTGRSGEVEEARGPRRDAGIPAGSPGSGPGVEAEAAALRRAPPVRTTMGPSRASTPRSVGMRRRSTGPRSTPTALGVAPRADAVLASSARSTRTRLAGGDTAHDLGVDPGDAARTCRPVGAACGPGEPGGRVPLPLGGPAVPGAAPRSPSPAAPVEEAPVQSGVGVDAPVAQEGPARAAPPRCAPASHLADQDLLPVGRRPRRCTSPKGSQRKLEPPELEPGLAGRAAARGRRGSPTPT